MPFWDPWLQKSNHSMGSIITLLLVLVVSTAWALSSAFSIKSYPRKFVPTKSKTPSNQQKSPLERCIDSSYEQEKEVVLLVDSNNVRGKTDFEWTNRDLLQLLRALKESQSSNLEIICVVDHGLEAQAVPYGFGLVVFAGPHRTADDVIAAATRWLCTREEEDTLPRDAKLPSIFVITSDRELRQRCMQNNRPGSFKQKKRQPQRDSVKVFDSPSFVRILEGLKVVDLDTSKTAADNIESHSWALEDDLRRFGNSRPPWSCKSERELALEGDPWYSVVLNRNSKDSAPSDPPSQRPVFNEKTWHRVLFAENLRRVMADSTPEEPATSRILRQYQSRFKAAASGEEKVDSMFLDHRIQFDPYQQQALLYYLDQAVDSVARNSSISSSFSPSETGHTAIMMAADSCTAFLRKLVQSYPEMPQKDLLSLYVDEAPSRLQFFQPSDLSALLHRVATREDSGTDTPQWLLRNASYDDEVRPRRRARRNLGRYRRVVDEALVEMGHTIEDRWFELLKC